MDVGGWLDVPYNTKHNTNYESDEEIDEHNVDVVEGQSDNL